MAISPLQQRMLMQRLRKDPRLAALVAAQAGGQGGLAELAGLPEGAVNLAELAGMGQEPQVVTPAQPAPVRQGAEVEAPVDMPQPNFRLGETQQQPVRPVGPGYQVVARPTTQEAILGEAAMQAAEESDRIRESAVVPEAIEKILSQREGRIGEELQNIQEDQKRAGWEALAMAGFKMAQSQSPYFMSALASGMEAGLSGYNAKKMERAERKARLQAQQEDAVLQREREKLSAEEREAQRASREQARVAQLLGLRQAAGKLAFEEQVRPFAVEAAKLEPAKTRAEIRLAEAKTGTEQAQAGYYGARAAGVDTAGGGGGGEGGERFTKSSAAQIASRAQTTMKDAEEAMASALDAGDRTAFRRAATIHTAALSDYNKVARFLRLNTRQSPRYQLPKSWINASRAGGGGGRQAPDPLGIR